MACQHHLSQAKVKKGREGMPLALNGTGTIFKKCSMSNHRPETVKRCASATCQHTCQTPEKCPHAWTLRYSVNGKQVEKSLSRHASKVSTGPFRALAQRVTAHPKVEWLLTRYPVRHWRAIHRWPPVVLLGLGRALARGPHRRLFWVYPPGGDPK